jgi:nucleotide-binding universal stress UspA family protein
MTKTILAPTDFSENDFFATLYASKLASKQGFAIELFHCYTTSSTVFDEENDNIPVLKADVLILEWKENLQKQFPALHVDTTCVAGLLGEVLPSLSREDKYNLIVMGTTGSGKGKPVAWGSNTNNIIYKAAVPVLAIPNLYDKFALDRVAMLTNFKPEELETLTSYIDNAGAIPQLDVIHVYKDIDDASKIEDLLLSWSFNVEQISGVDKVGRISSAIDKENIERDTVPEGIHHIIVAHDYDIILVSKTRKSFFERLFRTSVSKEIILNLDRPAFFDNNAT